MMTRCVRREPQTRKADSIHGKEFFICKAQNSSRYMISGTYTRGS